MPRDLHRISVRHARACPGHPRLASLSERKAWMAGTSPAMTSKWGNPDGNGSNSFLSWPTVRGRVGAERTAKPGDKNATIPDEHVWRDLHRPWTIGAGAGSGDRQRRQEDARQQYDHHGVSRNHPADILSRRR